MACSLVLAFPYLHFPPLHNRILLIFPHFFHRYTFCLFVLPFSIFAFSSTRNFSAPTPYDAPSDPLSRLGWGIPPPHSLPIDSFSVTISPPSASRFLAHTAPRFTPYFVNLECVPVKLTKTGTNPVTRTPDPILPTRWGPDSK